MGGGVEVKRIRLDNLHQTILDTYRIPPLPSDALLEVQEYFGIPKKFNCKGLGVVLLLRRMADKRTSTVRNFTKSIVPGLKTTSKKSYYMNHLCYRYGSAIGYYSASKGLRNWQHFLITPINKLNDPYSVNKDKDAKEGVVKVRKKRASIYAAMEEFFKKGGTAKECLMYLADQFPTKTNSKLKKTMKVYLYKFRKDYKIVKQNKIIKFIPKE